MELTSWRQRHWMPITKDINRCRKICHMLFCGVRDSHVRKIGWGGGEDCTTGTKAGVRKARRFTDRPITAHRSRLCNSLERCGAVRRFRERVFGSSVGQQKADLGCKPRQLCGLSCQRHRRGPLLSPYPGRWLAPRSYDSECQPAVPLRFERIFDHDIPCPYC